MSGRPSRDPRPLVERLVPQVFAGTHHSPVMSTFLRGVTTGALVGAAIAGSALWSRYRRGRGSAPESEPLPDGDAQEPQEPQTASGD